jgi:threonine aldolase
MKTIDLRSDTVTQPSAPMRTAMATAEVGDDVYGEDPTVNRLESVAANMLGMEEALFVCSGTQGNLLALLAHCDRGDEYIAGQQSHVYRWEGGGGAVFGGIQPQPLEFELNGTLDLDKVSRAIKPADYHCSRSRLLCLENTQGGKVLPLDYLERAALFAASNSLSLHLDGARLFNAAIQSNCDARDIVRHFHTVSVCLSKGLGAPVGALLCGSRDLITKARRWRKVAGGGMRQAGILAAAGIYALENNISRLAQDHRHAQMLAEGLATISQVTIEPKSVQTNMVFTRIRGGKYRELRGFLREHHILVGTSEPLRLVTHMDVDAEDIDMVVTKFREFFEK